MRDEQRDAEDDHRARLMHRREPERHPVEQRGDAEPDLHREQREQHVAAFLGRAGSCGARRSFHHRTGTRIASSQAPSRWSNCTVAMFQKKLRHAGSSMKSSGGIQWPFISGNVL